MVLLKALLPLFAVVGVVAADGPILVGLSRRSPPPAPVLMKRQDPAANDTAGGDAAGEGDNTTQPPTGIIPSGNSSASNETIGNPQGSVSGPNGNGSSGGGGAKGVGHETLTRLLATVYLAMNISVGTPPQDLLVTVALDESPGDLRLTGCNETTCLQLMQSYNESKVFDTSKSTSFKTNNATYNFSMSNGSIAADTVTVGGVSITDQPFMLQNDKASFSSGTMYGSSGTIPFGLNGDKSSLGGMPFYRVLAQNWPAREFGLFVAPMQRLSGQEFDEHLENSGELALGGLNKALYTGEVQYMPVSGNHWALPLNDIMVDGKSIMGAGSAGAPASPVSTSTDAAASSPAAGAAESAPANTTMQRRQEANTTSVASPATSPAAEPATSAPAPTTSPADSGTGGGNSAGNSTGNAALWLNGGSYVSPELGDKLVAAIPGANKTESTLDNVTSVHYMVPCDTNSTLSMDVGGYKLDLPASAWVFHFPGDGGCAAYIGPMNETYREAYGYGNDTNIVLGLHVLQNVYTAFKIGSRNATNGTNGADGPMIGFAQLSDAAKGVRPAPSHNSTGNNTIPGATENPAVTATGAGVSVSAPAATGTGGGGPVAAAAQKVAGSVGAVLLAAALAFVAL